MSLTVGVGVRGRMSLRSVVAPNLFIFLILKSLFCFAHSYFLGGPCDLNYSCHFSSREVRLGLHDDMLLTCRLSVNRCTQQRRWHSQEAKGFNILFMGRDEFSCGDFRELYATPGMSSHFWVLCRWDLMRY